MFSVLHGFNGGILFYKILLYQYVYYIMLTVLSSFTMYCTLSVLVMVFYNDISLGCNSSWTNYVARRVDVLRTRQLHTNYFDLISTLVTQWMIHYNR